jgi:epothilone synthetase B
VVLNSLGGEFMVKGLSTLAPFGRFLELGKRDIYANTPLNLGLFEKSVAFFAVSVGPEQANFGAVWREVEQHINAGHFRPLPYRVFPMVEVTRAFEYMAQAGHIGKIVIAQQEQSTLRQITESYLQSEILASGLSPAEGRDVFSRVLEATEAQVLISTRNFHARQQEYTASHLLSVLEEERQAKQTYQRPELSSSYVAPRDKSEEILVDIYRDLLGIAPVGIYDNFFDLGGHSLLGTQLIARVRDAFHLSLPLQSLFQEPTVAGLAGYIAASQSIIQSKQSQVNEHDGELEEGVL